MRRYAFPVLMGIVGVAVLMSLGFWQLRRMEWKEEIIANVDAMIARKPIWLSQTQLPDPETDRYRAVKVLGRFTGEEAYVLTSSREAGPGFLVIAVLETAAELPGVPPGSRRILVDRGFIPESEKNSGPRKTGWKVVVGNLNWPDDITPSTPPYDPTRDIWFGRDLPAIAAKLGAEPTLIVARQPTGDGIAPMPVDTSGIPNDHWGYAIQWFLLAATWAGMTLFLLWRIRTRKV